MLQLHSPKKKCPDCGGSGVNPDGDECGTCSGQGWYLRVCAR